MLSLVAGASLGAAEPAEGSKARMEITVQVYNQAGAPAVEVHKAESTASWMYLKAGIDVHWVECPPLERVRGGDQACRQPDDPALFVLSINPDCPPETSATAMGFAVLQGQSNHAAVVYPRIEAVSQKDPQCQDCALLGSAMAHELAHLIFHSARHTDGIMRAVWTSGDFRAMTQQRLVFTQVQVRTLRRMLAQRTGSVQAQ
ncbi:MAG: hypothetical protein KGN36_00390 [Acidobacteriota bacterium]|nr:hypothetical protein [Acidobacteriota bacterium]